jgi:hypothetical protein
MYLMKRAVSLVVFVLSCNLAIFASHLVDGEQLVTQCKMYVQITDGSLQSPTKSNFVNAGKCIAYVQAVVDTYQNLRQSPLIPKRALFCVPDEITGDEAVRITVKYLDDHPEDLHYAASSDVWTALHKAFPCPAK